MSVFDLPAISAAFVTFTTQPQLAGVTQHLGHNIWEGVIGNKELKYSNYG